MFYGLYHSDQAKDWLDNHPDRALVRIVATWIKDHLCADEETESLTIVHDTGQRREISRVPETKVDVTWIPTFPIHAMKVLWIEEDEEAEDPED